METAADLLVHAFYALNVAATVFFLHKVLWLYRYKKLQAILIQEAGARISAGQATSVAAFDRFAEAVWRSVPAATGAASLGEYVSRADELLRDVRRSLRTSRGSIRSLAMEAATSVAERTAAGTALSFPEVTTGAVRTIQWELSVPPLLATRRLDPQLYALAVRSRYGFFRRALVFFAGVADVVYSAQHVALLSHSPHAPTSVIVRRLSLVGLLVLLIMADLALGLRKAISRAIEAEIGRPTFASLGDSGVLLGDHFATIAGVVVWTAALSLVYFAAALAVRRHSRRFEKRLLAMKETEETDLRALRRTHEEELLLWLDGYARSLDQAVDLGAQHAELLVDSHRGRLHRRVVETSPVRTARAISAALLAELPDARGDLRDRATTERRSLHHHLWPREDEMRVEVHIAQVRAAWQDIEHALSRLSSLRPDPEAIDGLFRRLVTYAGAFRDLLPGTTPDDLQGSYRSTVEELVAETQADLDDLDARLAEIAARLTEQLEVASSLVRFQVEMTNHKIETSVGKLASEVLATRERARLEAMAFEI